MLICNNISTKCLHACIICLAVLSSLLNLMRGAKSEEAAAGGYEADSTELSDVEIHLLAKCGSIIAGGNKPGPLVLMS